MKTKHFIELPITEWNGRNHISSIRLINMDEVSQIIPNGKWKQTKVLLKNGKELFINEYFDDVKEMMKN